MILEEVTQSVLAIAATAMILTLFLRMVAVALKAVADGNKKLTIAAYSSLAALVFALAIVYWAVS